MKSKVLKLAHSIRSNFDNWSDALRAAWRLVKMQLGFKTKIQFAKETGELRAAEVVAIASLKTLEKGYFRFIELVGDKSQWRSCRLERMVF